MTEKYELVRDCEICERRWKVLRLPLLRREGIFLCQNCRYALENVLRSMEGVATRKVNAEAFNKYVRQED